MTITFRIDKPKEVNPSGGLTIQNNFGVLEHWRVGVMAKAPMFFSMLQSGLHRRSYFSGVGYSGSLGSRLSRFTVI
jgi:hypothetical protein